MNKLYRLPSDDPSNIIYKHLSGMIIHTMISRVEGFKELIRRANRNGGAWWLITNGEVFIAMSQKRGLYKGFWPIAKCTFSLTKPTRVELVFKEPKDFEFMVMCAAKGNMAMYDLLRDRSLDQHKGRKS